MEQHAPHGFVCPICKGSACTPALRTKDFHLTGEPFALVDCASCGMRSTFPHPSPSELGRYYQTSHYISHDASGKGPLQRLYRVARRLALSRKKALVDKLAPSSTLLDVGCGSGEFLAYMAHCGHRAEGVEPSPTARAKAQAASGCTVTASLDLVEGAERFAVATMWHVLEHFDDPGQCLKRLYALMKPEGYLLIAVPDRESWDARHYGPHWAAWDTPRHLWHFRRKDLRRLLELHGFEVRSTKPMWLDAFYIALLSERYRGRPGWLAWPLALVNGALSNANALLLQRSASSMLVLARKAHP